MELPSSLRLAIEEKAASIPHNLLQQAAQQLSLRYRQETGQGKRLLTRDIEAVSYAIVRMPATFGAVRTALGYTLSCLQQPIASVLDVGAGTGAGGWALLDAMDTPFTLTCLERESAMLRLGQELMGADPALSGTQWRPGDLCADPLPHHADLVMASYVLGEMTDKQRSETLLKLWNGADKLLLLIEPGTPAGFHQLLNARSALMRLGGNVIAPCPSNAACPLPEGDWCHFSCRVSRTRLHKLLKEGEVPYEDEKFCYLAVSKSPGTPAPARILRHPEIQPGHISLILCTKSGAEKITVTKKDGPLFKAARKASAGDSFPTE